MELWNRAADLRQAAESAAFERGAEQMRAFKPTLTPREER